VPLFENGKCFFVANHPFGILDGLILTYTVSQKYGTLKAIANDSFAFVPQLRPFVAAVNVFGKSSTRNMYMKKIITYRTLPVITTPTFNRYRRMLKADMICKYAKQNKNDAMKRA